MTLIPLELKESTAFKKIDSILYYARSVDPTIIVALSTLASEQSKAITQTIKNLHQLLNYLGTHKDAKIKYYASGNTNTRYQSAPNIHHIPHPQRNTEQQHKNQLKQMTSSPLYLK